MGACQGKRNTGNKTITLKDIHDLMPSHSATVKEKVIFFDSIKLSLFLRQNQNNNMDIVHGLIRKLQMNNQIDESLEEIKELCKQKSEMLLRSYNEHTELGLKVMQKVLEYYQNYFLQYVQVSTDIPIIKQIIAEQTFQMTIENLLIVNALLDKNLTSVERWWSDAYFAQRLQIISQTYQEGEEEVNNQQTPPLEPKDDFIRPFLDFLISLKKRVRKTIQLKQLMVTSIQGSTLLTQKHMNIFYQNMKDGLNLSIKRQCIEQPRGMSKYKKLNLNHLYLNLYFEMNHPPPPLLPPGHINTINSEQAPKETLYVSNLNDRINREDLKFALFFVFSQYGEIHKITLKKSNKMRGQAFVIFQNLTSSTNARAGLNGMVIFEKPMQLEFARTRSLIFEQIEGNFYAILPKDQKTLTKREQKALKRETKAAQKQQIILDPDANSILLAEELPQIVTEEALLELFGQYPGLKSVQLIMTRKLAFIEYDNEELASVALRGLNGFLLTITAPLKLRYARKT